MEFQQLRYFLESAENENFSHTAARNMVPPSTVSASVKKLEAELGCRLFSRSANKITLSHEGRIFADTVREALSLLDGAKARFHEESGELSGEIRMLIRTERSVVSERIMAFRKRHPRVSFRLSHTFHKTDISGYDIIIDEASAQYGSYLQQPFLTENIYIAAAAGSPLVGRQLALNQLRDADFITMSSGSSLYRRLVKLCGEAGFEPRIIIESDDPRYICRYIAGGFGISLFPERSWEAERGDDIAFLNITDLFSPRTTYVYSAPECLRCVRAFCEELCGTEE